MAIPCIGIINTSVETIELLQELMEDEGYATVTRYIIDFKRGAEDVQHFFATYQPAVVIYDIALPYVENWTFFQESILGARVLSHACFVVTTTNKAVLEGLIGPNNSIELVGRPFDLDAVIRAVRHALTHDC